MILIMLSVYVIWPRIHLFPSLATAATKTTKVNHSPSLCPRPLNAEKPLPAPLLALLQLPAVSMRLNLHFALCCKCAQVEVMLRRCVFFQHRNRDTFGGAIPSTFGQDLSVHSL